MVATATFRHVRTTILAESYSNPGLRRIWRGPGAVRVTVRHCCVRGARRGARSSLGRLGTCRAVAFPVRRLRRAAVGELTPNAGEGLALRRRAGEARAQPGHC